MDMTNFGETDYTSITTPSGYTCSKCNIKNHRLWRQYQTFLDHVELFCIQCACENQKFDINEVFKRGDQIGWLIPAVPTEEGNTFWGYTSVPFEGVEWWYNLPVNMVE